MSNTLRQPKEVLKKECSENFFDNIASLLLLKKSSDFFCRRMILCPLLLLSRQALVRSQFFLINQIQLQNSVAVAGVTTHICPPTASAPTVSSVRHAPLPPIIRIIPFPPLKLWLLGHLFTLTPPSPALFVPKLKRFSNLVEHGKSCQFKTNFLRPFQNPPLFAPDYSLPRTL